VGSQPGPGHADVERLALVLRPAVTGRPRRRLPRWGSEPLLLAPLLLLLALFFVLPLGLEVWSSLTQPRPGLSAYRAVFQQASFLRSIATTLQIAATVTAAAGVIGYLVAYALTRLRGRLLTLMLALALVPFWISAVIRSFSWMLLLERSGPVNGVLLRLGLIGQPLQLLYNRTVVEVVMVSVLLPYMILPVYSVMRGIDLDLMKAAASLGASPLQAFCRVFLPLSLPGVASGGLLVFILALGYFVTPSLLGGPKEQMVAVLIYQQTQLFNWPVAFALATVLLVVVVALYGLAVRLLGLGRILFVQEPLP